MSERYYGHAVIRHDEGRYDLIMFLAEEHIPGNSKMLVAWQADGTIIEFGSSKVLDEMMTALKCAVAAMEVEWGDDAPVVKRMTTLIDRVEGVAPCEH